jgi:hypothetical protein
MAPSASKSPDTKVTPGPAAGTVAEGSPAHAGGAVVVVATVVPGAVVVVSPAVVVVSAMVVTLVEVAVPSSSVRTITPNTTARVRVIPSRNHKNVDLGTVYLLGLII